MKDFWNKCPLGLKIILGFAISIVLVSLLFFFKTFISNLFGFVISLFITPQYSMAEIKNDFEIIKNLAWMIGGILGLGIAVWRGVIADKNQKSEQRKELHERYARAVELLSDEKSEAVRMGALYSLKQIAEENDGEFFEQCKEIIAGYVRNQLQERVKNPDRTHELAEDIKTGINILSFLADSEYFNDRFINLQGVDIEGVDVSKSDIKFKKLNFSYAVLRKIKFKLETDLSTCRFINTDFQEANLPEINFQGTSLAFSKFQGARMSGVQFQGANIDRANFEGAKLVDIKLNQTLISKESFDKYIDNDQYEFFFLKDYFDKNPSYDDIVSAFYRKNFDPTTIPSLGVVIPKEEKLVKEEGLNEKMLNPLALKESL